MHWVRRLCFIFSSEFKWKLMSPIQNPETLIHLDSRQLSCFMPVILFESLRAKRRYLQKCEKRLSTLLHSEYNSTYQLDFLQAVSLKKNQSSFYLRNGTPHRSWISKKFKYVCCVSQLSVPIKRRNLLLIVCIHWNYTTLQVYTSTGMLRS